MTAAQDAIKIYSFTHDWHECHSVYCCQVNSLAALFHSQNFANFLSIILLIHYTEVHLLFDLHRKAVWQTEQKATKSKQCKQEKTI